MGNLAAVPLPFPRVRVHPIEERRTAGKIRIAQLGILDAELVRVSARLPRRAVREAGQSSSSRRDNG